LVELERSQKGVLFVESQIEVAFLVDAALDIVA
jgi:hypothetical protein